MIKTFGKVNGKISISPLCQIRKTILSKKEKVAKIINIFDQEFLLIKLQARVVIFFIIYFLNILSMR